MAKMRGSPIRHDLAASAAEAECQRLRARVARLEVALKEWGQHKPYCGATKPDDHVYCPCSCGLDEARARGAVGEKP